jgi:hypothetical protein
MLINGKNTGIGFLSEVTQKKASSPYGTTTEAVVIPKQGVTPKGTSPDYTSASVG